MNNPYTLSAAIEYGSKGKIEEWVHIFLRGEGGNIEFSDGLLLQERFYTKPIMLPLRLFSRCCGPEDNMQFIVDKNCFEENVRNIHEKFLKGWDMPPLIVNYSADNGFVVSDGNHRFEMLIRNRYEKYYTIIWTSSKQEFIDMSEKVDICI
jgi:hypothetical protein